MQDHIRAYIRASKRGYLKKNASKGATRVSRVSALQDHIRAYIRASKRGYLKKASKGATRVSRVSALQDHLRAYIRASKSGYLKKRLLKVLQGFLGFLLCRII